MSNISDLVLANHVLTGQTVSPANPSSIPAAAASWPISPWASLQIESFIRAGQSAEPAKAARVAIDRLVLDAPGIRSVVLCNTMIYGNSLGPPAQSVPIPALVRQAKASGVARYVGRGLNRWSNAHVADVAALYALALTNAQAKTKSIILASLRAAALEPEDRH